MYDMKSGLLFVDASLSSRTLCPKRTTSPFPSRIRLGTRLVAIRIKIEGKRRISFMNVNILIVLDIASICDGSSPASRHPKFSLKPSSPMMSTVKQLNQVVKSTTPLHFCACASRILMNFSTWLCNASSCSWSDFPENARDWSLRSLR